MAFLRKCTLPAPYAGDDPQILARMLQAYKRALAALDPRSIEGIVTNAFVALYEARVMLRPLPAPRSVVAAPYRSTGASPAPARLLTTQEVKELQQPPDEPIVGEVIQRLNALFERAAERGDVAPGTCIAMSDLCPVPSGSGDGVKYPKVDAAKHRVRVFLGDRLVNFVVNRRDVAGLWICMAVGQFFDKALHSPEDRRREFEHWKWCDMLRELFPVHGHDSETGVGVQYRPGATRPPTSARGKRPREAREEG